MAGTGTDDPLVARLGRAGCVAATEEAAELRDAARGDDELLEQLVARRERGEPIAWITGWTQFVGQRIRVRPGVYVPRWQTEPLARRAVELLPGDGTAVDLCTGSGAIAAVLSRGRPSARVVASDCDPDACSCARENGVEVYLGDLAEPLPGDLRGRCDVVTAVPPYVPTDRLSYLPRDVLAYEPRLALDGGRGGTEVATRVVLAARALLRPGSALLLEVGGDQDRELTAALEQADFFEPERLIDEEGDLRGLVALRRSPARPA